MSTLTLNDLPKQILASLKERAETSGRSLEAEAVSALEEALVFQTQLGFGHKLRARFEGIYGDDLDVPRTHLPRETGSLDR